MAKNHPSFEQRELNFDEVESSYPFVSLVEASQPYKIMRKKQINFYRSKE